MQVIVPTTTTDTWLRFFADVPALAVPRGPIVLVVPHPDDETLGAGLLLATLAAQQIPVTVVAVTDGENAYDIPPDERLALGKLRIQEQEEALVALGLDTSCVHRLHLPDSGLLPLESTVTKMLGGLCTAGGTVVAPWIGDFHPDHVACARSAEAVVKAIGGSLLSYFFWTWHRGDPALLNGLHLRRLHGQPDAQVRKKRALGMHRSQLAWDDGNPILPAELLAPATWPFEVFIDHA